MRLNELISIMEKIAPPELAFPYDNPGLLVGTERDEIKNVLLALDCTLPTAREAVRKNADLVITHHPMFFNGIKHILPNDPETAAAYHLIRHGIGLYAAHTNLDAAQGGVNDTLAEIFSLHDIKPLPPEDLGRIGRLPEKMSLYELCILTEKKLNTSVRAAAADFKSDPREVSVRTIALIGGSGGGDVRHAYEAGADVLITGEIKHSQAIEAQTLGLSVIQAGHHETEVIVMPALLRRLQDLNLGVQFSLAEDNYAPLKGV